MSGRRYYCCFCGRESDECPGGLWHFGFDRRARLPGSAAICIYCARAAIRGFGEVPDPTPVEPVPIFARRSHEPEDAA